MFERYTERARRVVFFGRYEASEFGSSSIDTHHMLLALLREDKNLLRRFVEEGTSLEFIRREIESRVERNKKVPTSADLPLSDECKHILAYANEESEMLGHRHIGTEHMLLGILRETGCLAAEILAEKGMKLEDVREQLRKSVTGAEKLRSYGLSLNSDMLMATIDKHGFAVSKDHLLSALTQRTGGDLNAAEAELQLFLDSLIHELSERSEAKDLLAPVLEGFDWHSSLGRLRTGVDEENGWKFRFWFTLLLAELLLQRYERNT